MDGASITPPALLMYELTNVAYKKVQRGELSLEESARILRETASLDVRLMDVEYVQVLELALEYQLSAYDASYLWVARAQVAPLVTLDDKLHGAATAMGV